MKSINYRRGSARRAAASIDSVLARAIALAIFSLGGAGCVAESDEACDAHQVYKAGGTILEYAVCVCDESQGYVFDEPSGHGCKRCADGQTIVAGKCVSPVVDAGADQDGSSASEPTGVGEYCDTTADCAAFDATYCAVAKHTCLVEKCAAGEHTCSSSSTCCDYSALKAGFSLCLPPDQLTGDACPMGGMKVEP
jgi:hypothetical protein